MFVMSLGFNVADGLAILVFVGAWYAYHFFVESSRYSKASLNVLMNQHRHAWMRQMVRREVRILDGNLMSSLQSGTAFFATSTLFALGATLAMLRSPNEVLSVFADLPFAEQPTRAVWEIKVIGLACILVYAFFKFAWSYRLFNYAAILIGAAAPHGSSPERLEASARRAAGMNIVAGRHFNRGQRAFFFALAYLGWFLSPWFFIATTCAALFAMYRRQFASDALHAIRNEPLDED